MTQNFSPLLAKALPDGKVIVFISTMAASISENAAAVHSDLSGPQKSMVVNGLGYKVSKAALNMGECLNLYLCCV